jgi:hypothetical protein
MVAQDPRTRPTRPATNDWDGFALTEAQTPEERAKTLEKIQEATGRRRRSSAR